MLFHTCKEQGEVFIDLSSRLHLLAKFTAIRVDGIRPSNVIMQEVINKDNEPEYYCSSCNKKVDVDSLNCICQMCGHSHSLSDLYKVSDVGGIYCKKCSEEYFPDKRRYILSKIMSKFANE